MWAATFSRISSRVVRICARAPSIGCILERRDFRIHSRTCLFLGPFSILIAGLMAIPANYGRLWLVRRQRVATREAIMRMRSKRACFSRSRSLSFLSRSSLSHRSRSRFSSFSLFSLSLASLASLPSLVDWLVVPFLLGFFSRFSWSHRSRLSSSSFFSLSLASPSFSFLAVVFRVSLSLSSHSLRILFSSSSLYSFSSPLAGVRVFSELARSDKSLCPFPYTSAV